jgi:Protein of unknown function (DUF1573)
MTISRLFFTLLLLSITPLSIFAQDVQIEDFTDNKGRVAWQWRVSVGDVSYEKPVTAEFHITNQSDTMLIIKDVLVGCHCTIVEIPKEPILPGATAILRATYDAKKEGRFYKLIRVLTNFDQNQYVTLAMEGNVRRRHMGG